MINKDTVMNQMNEDLLTIIREIDPNDRQACDELNARFWCFVNRRAYKGKSKKGHHFNLEMALSYRDPVIKDVTYTHSLDALKTVQDAELDGWCYDLNFCSDGFYCTMWEPVKSADQEVGWVRFNDVYLPTMSLAWMDAIVHAITWKRENENDTE